MLKIIAVLGGALMAYGLYFMMFLRETLDIVTENVLVMRFMGKEYQLFSKEILAILCIVGGFLIALFATIIYLKNRKR